MVKAGEGTKGRGRITGLTIERLAQQPGRHGLGESLTLLVRAPGRASWCWRYQRGAERIELGLGSWPVTSLTMAREKLFAAKRLLAAGRDPREERRAERAKSNGENRVSFGEATNAWLVEHAGEWGPKAAQAWAMTLKRYALPMLGGLSCAEVTVDQVVAVLRPLWRSKLPTALKLQRRMAAVLDYARARGWRSGENPARWRGQLEFRLEAPAKVHRTRHHAAVAYSALPVVMAKLAKAKGIAALATRFVALTACRPSAVTGARWGEIDGDAWHLPAARSKIGRDLRIALSPQALAVQREAKHYRRHTDDLVFPGLREGRPLSLTALSKALRLAGGGDGTTHGLRSAFKSWASDQGENHVHVEQALGHLIGSAVERAYIRSDFLAARLELMARWGQHLVPKMTSRQTFKSKGRRR